MAPRPGSPFARRAATFWIAGVSLCLLLYPARPALPDIFRWEDGQGTIHFTDDPSTIPPGARGNADLYVREAPRGFAPDAPASGSPVRPPGDLSPGAAPPSPDASDFGTEEEIISEVEALKAKIAAKERHIEAVDRKRSLALNPLRNRIVDPPDMALYEKYRKELPVDRERLRNLEAALPPVVR